MLKITPNKFLLQNLQIGKLEGTSGNHWSPSGTLEPDKDACARGLERLKAQVEIFGVQARRLNQIRKTHAEISGVQAGRLNQIRLSPDSHHVLCLEFHVSSTQN